LLPESALPFRIDRGRILPGFLDARDVPWLRVLVDEIDRFRGLPVRDLLERLRQPMPCFCPPFKSRAAIAVLLRLWKSELDAVVAPEKAREILFCAAAAQSATPRAAAVEVAAQTLAVTPAAVERALFADLPGEKLVSAPGTIPSPDEIALRTNQLIARSLLFHARRVRIKAEGATRALVRQAKLRGLICNVTDGAPPVLELSGPFTVFRHTLLYGRALGELVQFLPHCARFKLRAECILREREATLDLQSGDPIFPSTAPQPFDSKLEERFARDLKKAAPDWDLVREPEPVAAGSSIIFPDFLLRHRLCPQRSFLVEIVGFWSADYLARKLALLRQAGIDNLILCVDEARICGASDLPAGARIVRFRRRIDPLAVLAAVGDPLPTECTATDLRP
jgi:predicted nuclease of restriction endonuclease-like RecB superfamily